jgi:hypothetical protein
MLTEDSFTSEEFSVYKNVMIRFRMFEYGETYSQAFNAIPRYNQFLKNNVILKNELTNLFV